MGNQKATWENLPIEIKEKMLEYQLKQTGKKDESVFIKDIKNAIKEGGFLWDGTEDCYDFWNEILCNSNFDLFFEKYPKQFLNVK